MTRSSPEEAMAERLMRYTFVAVVLVTGGALVAIGLSDSGKAQSFAEVAASALGVVGSLGGLFVGHRLGSSGRRQMEDRLDAHLERAASGRQSPTEPNK